MVSVGWKLAQKSLLCHFPVQASRYSTYKSQIPLRYPASEPARELVADLLANYST